MTAWRRALATAALLCHGIAALGLPVPVPRRSDSSAPYPCQNRPCACATSQQCWAGDCCCFTLEEKLAWADERGHEPPQSARDLAAARRPKPAAEPASCCAAKKRPAAKSCCAEDESESPPVRWASLMSVRQCRGDGPLGLFLAAEPAVPPAFEPVAFDRAGAGGFARAGDESAPSTSDGPAVPPPRHV